MKNINIDSLAVIITTAIVAALKQLEDTQTKPAKSSPKGKFKTPLAMLASTLPVCVNPRKNATSLFFNRWKNLIDINVKAGTSISAIGRYILSKDSSRYQTERAMDQALRNWQNAR